MVRLLIAVLGVVALLSAAAGQDESPAHGGRMRLLYWNIQNGMWDGQRDDYARFVAFVKAYDPDVCVWCEAQSIFATGSDKERLAEKDRFLPDGWKNLAARYGHANVFLGGHRDNYPQVITSRLPLEGVRRLYGPDGRRIRHGAGWAVVKVGDRAVNVVTVHTWPQPHAPGLPDKAAARKRRKEHGGDPYRRHEVEQICRETIFTQTNAADACWIMLGDFNSLTRADNHAYKLPDDDTKFLPHDFLREKTPYRDILAIRYPGVLMPSCLEPRRIDFVYLTPPLVDCTKSARVLVDGYTSNSKVPGCSFCTPSDHLPILLDFDFGVKRPFPRADGDKPLLR